MDYNIYFDNKAIGVASVESAGLYTEYQCRCKFDVRGSYRIIAQYGALQVDLGLCYPEKNFFVTRARVANNKLNGALPYFLAVDNKHRDKKFIPINPNEQFLHIAKLNCAFFIVRNNIKGIVINKD